MRPVTRARRRPRSRALARPGQTGGDSFCNARTAQGSPRDTAGPPRTEAHAKFRPAGAAPRRAAWGKERRFSRQERRPAVSNCNGLASQVALHPGRRTAGIGLRPARSFDHRARRPSLRGVERMENHSLARNSAAHRALAQRPAHSARPAAEPAPARPPPQVALCAPSSAQSSPSRSILPPQGAAAEHRAGSVPESARSCRCARQ